MQQPSRRLDRQLERFVQRLPACWQELMVRLKAFSYGKKIKTPQVLLRVILAYCGLDMSLREVAGLLTLSEETLSDEAVRQRLNLCGDFLEALLKEILQIDALPSLPPGRRVLLFDGTSIEAPGSRGSDYRIHLCIHLLSLQFVDLQVSDSSKGETLKNFSILPQDIVLGDRAYCSVSAVLETVLDRKADFLVRWQSRANLYEKPDREQPIQLAERLKDLLPGQSRSFPVWVGYSLSSREKDKRCVQCYVHVFRMTEEQAKAAKRRLSRKKSRKQQKLSYENIFLSQFVILLTSLSPEDLPTETALSLYRCRWQVELVIKRLKSVLNIDKLRARRGGKLAQVYLYGKLLYALLLDEQLRTHWLAPSDSRLDSPRKSTPWRACTLLRRALEAAVLQVHCWKPEAFGACQRVMTERPRRRQLQTLPQRFALFLSAFEQQAAA